MPKQLEPSISENGPPNFNPAEISEPDLVVSIRGASGIGKSVLASQLTEFLQKLGHRVEYRQQATKGGRWDLTIPKPFPFPDPYTSRDIIVLELEWSGNY